MFLEGHRLDEAHIILLIELGRILKAAEIHVKNGDALKAVEILTAPATYSADHARPAIKYFLAELRQGLTFGVLPTSGSVASKLLVLADQLDKSVMTEQEVDEVSPFN